MTYYIYEVPGNKVGATKHWDQRKDYNFDNYQIEPIIIETIEGPDTEDFWQVVGDREWELADLKGYDRGTHYKTTILRGRRGGFKRSQQESFKNINNIISNESRSNAGKIGGRSEGTLANLKKFTSDSERQSRVGKMNKGCPKRKATCPKCGKVMSSTNIDRHINRTISCA